MDCAIHARGPWATLTGPAEAVSAAAAAVSAESPGARYTDAYRRGRWDGIVCLMRSPRARPDDASGRRTYAHTFPAGLTERVAAALRAGGFAVTLSDFGKSWPREAPQVSAALLGVELRAYQIQAADEAMRRQRLSLECPTGGGKTEIGAEIIRRHGGPALWLTHRAELAKQTRERLRSRLGVGVGLVGAGAEEFLPITVGMVPTLARRVRPPRGASPDPSVLERLRSFRLLIFDEAHHGGAETWLAVSEACERADVRVGLSGTVLTGDPLRDLRLEGIAGPRVVVASAAELAGAGFLATPTVRLLEPPPASYPTYESVREAVLPTWRRDARPLQRMGTKLFGEAYRRGVVENDARTRAIAEAVLRHYRAGEKVLVLANLVAHAARLDAAAGALGAERRWLITGESAGRAEVLARFRHFDPPCLLVATPWSREGIDLPEVDVGFLAGATLSEIATLQSVGRMLRVRPDKRTVLIYAVLDGRDPGADRDYLAAHTRAQLEIFRKLGWAIERAGRGDGAH